MTIKENVEKLHRASLRILEKTGLALHHPEILEACAAHGLKVDGQKVYFQEKQLMELVARAPGSFTVTPYNPARAVEMGRGRTTWASGGGASNVLEPDLTYRPAIFEDYVKFMKLGQQASALTALSTLVVQASDLPLEHSAALKFFYASQLSDKALVAVSSDRRTNRTVLAAAEALYGGPEELRKQPRFFGIVSTLSPLRMDSNALEALMDWARAGQPSAMTPCAMAGSTGPMTLAGTMALSNAETLAAVALAQLVAPGAPVLYGCQSTTVDPRTASISIGAPEQTLFIRYGAALADFYGLPCRGGGLLTDADQVGVQSGYEAMMSGSATRRAGYDLAMHGTGIVCGYAAMSFEQYMVDLEIIGMIEREAAGLEVDDRELALDLIDALGSEGGYLTEGHTTKNCRRNWTPQLSYRGHLGGPGNRDWMSGRINRHMGKLLESYAPPDLPPSAVRDMQKALAGFGITGGALF